MIKKELYDLTLYKEIITEEDLIKIKYTKEEIESLVKKGILKKIENKKYCYIADDKLYAYGEYLLNDDQTFKARKCFEKCLEINKYNIKANKQLLLYNIRKENVKNVVKYLENLYYYDTDEMNAWCNTVLYLFALLKKLPIKYVNYIYSLESNDLQSDQNENLDKIRYDIFKQRFFKALNQLKQKNLLDRISVDGKIMFQLLSKNITRQSKVRDEIWMLVSNKQYVEILNYLKEQSKKAPLSHYYYLVYKATSDLLKIKETKKISPFQDCKTDNNLEAIEIGDYKRAISFREVYYFKYSNYNNKNIVDELLKNMGIELTKNKKEVEGIKENLEVLNIKKAIELILEYLNKIGKLEYENLIIESMEISLIDYDYTFKEPLSILNKISKGEYIFDKDLYISLFNKSILEKKYQKAQNYLNILEKYSDIRIDDYIEKIKQLKKEERKKRGKNSLEYKYYYDFSKVDSNLYYIEEKLKDLEENGMVLLDYFNDEKLKEIYSILERIDNIHIEPISYKNKKRLAIFPLNSNLLNYKQLNQKVNEAFNNKNYNLSAKYLKKMLTGGHPKGFVCCKLGVYYLKRNKKDLALDYFIVANSLNNELELENKIESLRQEIDALEYEKNVDVDLTEDVFINDLDEFYGIENFDEILYLIKKGLSITEICQLNNIDEDTKNIICLILAKKYYADDLDIIGDNYLKMVEKSKRNSETNKILQEVKNNKKFYKYRKISSH